MYLRTVYADIPLKMHHFQVRMKLEKHLGETVLQLNRLRLTHVPFTALLTGVRNLDVSENRLTSLASMAYLVNLQELNASGNSIESLDGLQALTALTELNVAENPLPDWQALKHVADCPKLAKFMFCEAPISFKQEELAKVQQAFENRNCRLFPFFL